MSVIAIDVGLAICAVSTKFFLPYLAIRSHCKGLDNPVYKVAKQLKIQFEYRRYDTHACENCSLYGSAYF